MLNPPEPRRQRQRSITHQPHGFVLLAGLGLASLGGGVGSLAGRPPADGRDVVCPARFIRLRFAQRRVTLTPLMPLPRRALGGVPARLVLGQARRSQARPRSPTQECRPSPACVDLGGSDAGEARIAHRGAHATRRSGALARSQDRRSGRPGPPATGSQDLFGASPNQVGVAATPPVCSRVMVAGITVRSWDTPPSL